MVWLGLAVAFGQTHASNDINPETNFFELVNKRSTEFLASNVANGGDSVARQSPAAN